LPASGSASVQFGTNDVHEPNVREHKPWELEAIWETHRLLRSSDLEGYATNKTVNVGFVYGKYDLTRYDRVWVRFGMYERFIADDTETGFRADDAVAAYTRLIPLPERIKMRLSGQLSAPLSFGSQKEGLISEGRVTLGLERKFGDFTLNFRTFTSGYLMRYSTAKGGNANPKVSWAALLGGEYQFPFLTNLNLGAVLVNEYSWYYNTADSGTSTSSQYGAVKDPFFPNQPVQQTYGGEVYLKWVNPDLDGLRTDLTVSFAQGDPSLGYTSALHDGVRHLYPAFWRQTSQVYFALTGTY
jgi:hypothetical protein